MIKWYKFVLPEDGRGSHALSLEHVHVGDVLLDARAGGAEGAAGVHAVLSGGGRKVPLVAD